MRKSTRWTSLIAVGLFLFSILASPVLAATPEALDSYGEAVQGAMTEDGQISADDRSLLDDKKEEFGLTDEEAKHIEEQIRQAKKQKQY